MTAYQLVGSAARGLLAKAGLDVRRLRPARDSTRQLAVKMAERGVRSLIDVGANMGQFGQAVRKAGYGGALFSIEPLSAAHAICARVAARDPNWHLLAPMALGAAAGAAEINVAKNLASSSFLEVDARSLAAAPESGFTGKEKVDIQPLDAIADPAWPRPLALKIDTQGYEREVLAGAAATLADVELILVEMSLTPLYRGAPSFAELYAMIEGLGFRCIGMTQGFTDHDRSEVLQVDALFIRDRAGGAP
jgi:FkbM family methyltransferase